VFKSHGASTVLSMSMISLIRIFFFTWLVVEAPMLVSDAS
jgi:hypothetical protein